MTIGGSMIEFPWQLISAALRASMMAEISEDGLGTDGRDRMKMFICATQFSRSRVKEV